MKKMVEIELYKDDLGNWRYNSEELDVFGGWYKGEVN